MGVAAKEARALCARSHMALVNQNVSHVLDQAGSYTT